jgi:hypothetical protein
MEAADMISTERRRAPRYPTDWAARYRYDSDPMWRPCRILNVSFDGAAVELHTPFPHEPLSGWFHLQISSVAGDELGVTIRGDLRRFVRTAHDRAVAGIQFQLTDAERELLHLLVGLRTSA